MNSKTTKRALISSVLALVMCFTMLIGTTFAWFTDSATSKGNVIKTGKLDVELYQWTDATSKKNISDSNDPIFTDDILWEPGKTQVVYLSIKNAGSLALKYKVSLNVTEVSTDSLTDVMEYAISPDAKYGEVTSWVGNGIKVSAGSNPTSANDVELLPGEEHFFALSVHMIDEANNDYMEETIKFNIDVLAAQLAYEEDSFGNQYDAEALYAVAEGLYVDKTTGAYVALTKDGLYSAAALASSDSSITSVLYDTDEGTVEVPVAKDSAALDTAIKADNEIVVVTNGDYTVDNAKGTTVTIVGNGENTNFSVESEGEYNTDYGFDGSTVTFENLVFNVNGYLNGYARMNATYNKCTINGTYTLNGSSVFNDCIFNKTGDDYCVWTWGAPTAEFNNCTFNTSGKAILLYGGANTVLTLNGCTFNDNGDISGKAAIETGSDWTTDTKTIVINNCTVNGFDVTEQKSITYGGTNLGTNVWGNKNLLPETRLSVTVNGVKVYGN